MTIFVSVSCRTKFSTTQTFVQREHKCW